jgi:outer membrane protein
MKKLLVSAAIAASLMAPAAVQAQAVPPAAVAVVDLERVTTDCVACKVATSTLRGQVTSMQNREKSLSDSLGTEQKAIQALVDALAGKAPDAALETRAKAWQSKRDQAAQEVGKLQQQIQNNQRYVQQQILAKLGPIYQTVMQKRGANVLIETGSTLATTTNIDVTSDVLAALNAGLPSLSTTAPAAPAQPQGR